MKSLDTDGFKQCGGVLLIVSVAAIVPVLSAGEYHTGTIERP